MNRSVTSSVKRIRESAWCCGQNYQRWRFANSYAEFPAGHVYKTGNVRVPGHTHCRVCGKPLVFRKVTKPSLDRYYRLRAANLDAGLNCSGTKPRRKNFNIPTPTDKAWRELRSSMSVVVLNVEDVVVSQQEIYT